MDVRVGPWRKWSAEELMLWTVVLEKTLEGPLDCKEIQPVHPNGDPSWVFIGRTDAEAEAPLLWLLLLLLSHFSGVRLFATPWITARQASLSITNSQSLLKLMSIESVMPSSHLILCRPLLLPLSMFPSIRVCQSPGTTLGITDKGLFKWVSSSYQVAKVLEF